MNTFNEEQESIQILTDDATHLAMLDEYASYNDI